MAYPPTHLRYHKPSRHRTKTIVKEHTGYTRTVRTHTADEYHSKDFIVPACFMINPRAICDLVWLKNKPALAIAMILTTHINRPSEDKQNKVTISQQQLALDTNLSLRTVNTAITDLVKLNLIQQVGKQEYLLMPSLGWYGGQTDWAEALQEQKLIGK